MCDCLVRKYCMKCPRVLVVEAKNHGEGEKKFYGCFPAPSPDSPYVVLGRQFLHMNLKRIDDIFIFMKEERCFVNVGNTPWWVWTGKTYTRKECEEMTTWRFMLDDKTFLSFLERDGEQCFYYPELLMESVNGRDKKDILP